MKDIIRKASVLAGSLMIALFFIGWSKAPQKPPELGLCPLKESQAYSQFLNRPLCESSKALFLIDRFKNLPHEIIYDGHTYKLKSVSGIASTFLRFNSKKDWPAKQWILKYANRSLGQNELIMLRLADGRTYRAGELLMRELESLEKTMAEVSVPQPQMELPKQFNVRVEGNAITPEALALPSAAK